MELIHEVKTRGSIPVSTNFFEPTNKLVLQTQTTDNIFALTLATPLQMVEHITEFTQAAKSLIRNQALNFHKKIDNKSRATTMAFLTSQNMEDITSLTTSRKCKSERETSLEKSSSSLVEWCFWDFYFLEKNEASKKF